MRPLFIALLGILGCLSASANVDSPKNLRVCVQYIEMPHPVLTELLSGKAESGAVVHEKAMALAKEGKAKLLESCMIMTRSGQRTMIETIREVMYLTEFNNLPRYSSVDYKIPLQPTPPASFPVVPNFNSFETRNVGVTLVIDPTLDQGGKLVDLWLVPEVVNLTRFHMIQKHVDEWGFDSIQMPDFETWITRTLITLLVGKFDLAATITPKPADPVPATLRKILVFVRCDVLPVGK